MDIADMARQIRFCPRCGVPMIRDADGEYVCLACLYYEETVANIIVPDSKVKIWGGYKEKKGE